uniref:Uncharacterized protein n=1 Tax=Candidatus Kentrum sp. MB TaxID=2138164 RepID=A0A451BEV5_9GAMM|nr:MAG: hypothetical protein BECKMB1821I_GA0114274_101936 [Candidatus Kentron sp. MB]VFK30980.1 MAG: hypothetical protein BECKMB1821G_GA0114241_107411 [Candidatus Kentron sp. MB]VFK76812.1 MAG: hypothetical protein BECKMB1821H_GA0114242_107611 [Candidatus Kentron sp. MB]
MSTGPKYSTRTYNPLKMDILIVISDWNIPFRFYVGRETNRSAFMYAVQYFMFIFHSNDHIVGSDTLDNEKAPAVS